MSGDIIIKFQPNLYMNTNTCLAVSLPEICSKGCIMRSTPFKSLVKPCLTKLLLTIIKWQRGPNGYVGYIRSPKCTLHFSTILCNICIEL